MTKVSNRDIERRIFDSVTGACAVEINQASYGRAVVVLLPDHDAMFLLTIRDGEEEKVLSDFAQSAGGMIPAEGGANE